MKTDITFTDEQLSDWRDYEDIRQSGAYNMFDPRARAATGIPRDRYLFVMTNYSALKEQAGHKDA